MRQRLILPKGALVGNAGQGDSWFRLRPASTQGAPDLTSPAALKSRSRGLQNQVAD